MEAMPHVLLDLVADITCPWCFIARRHLAAALAELAAEGLRLVPAWRPFLLHPDAPAGGFEQAEHLCRRFGTLEAADRYHDAVAEAGRAVGIDFRYDRIRATPDTTKAHRLLLAAAPSGCQWTLAELLAADFFTNGADIAEPAVLRRLSAQAGMDAAAAGQVIDGDAYLLDVQSSDKAAKRAGIRHVPAFCLHGRILPVPVIEDLAATLRSAHRALTRP